MRLMSPSIYSYCQNAQSVKYLTLSLRAFSLSKFCLILGTSFPSSFLYALIAWIILNWVFMGSEVVGQVSLSCFFDL